jgi:hypothetical protein
LDRDGVSVAQAAGVMVGEQSSGTFVKVPGETEAWRNRQASAMLQHSPFYRVSSVERACAPPARS